MKFENLAPSCLTRHFTASHRLMCRQDLSQLQASSTLPKTFPTHRGDRFGSIRNGSFPPSTSHKHPKVFD